MNKITTIEAYILGYPIETQAILRKLDALIRQIVPTATQAIKYGIPTYVLNGNLVHYAAYKNHIGFYPTPSGIDNFKEELSDYVTSMGAVQFPIAKELPWELIRRMVEFRVGENLQNDKGFC